MGTRYRRYPWTWYRRGPLSLYPRGAITLPWGRYGGWDVLPAGPEPDVSQT
jgi:hypothetical protein